MYDTDAIRRDYPIADVAVASGLEMRPSGGRFTGICPFHRDSRPSFVVYPVTQSYYCFGCGASGDVIDFVSRLNHLDFRGALALLAGAQPPAVSAAARPQFSPHPVIAPQESAATVDAAAAFYHERLWAQPEALAYLAARGVSEATIRQCRLGFGAPGLTRELLHRGLDLDIARSVGLLAGERECFWGRVIIPGCRGGQATWLTGRSLDEAEPRYLNIRQEKPLLGIAAVHGPAVLVTEGPFDWLTAVGWNFPAVALLGTRISTRVLEQLDRFERIYLALDQDAAGIEATAVLLDRLGGRAIGVPLLPGVVDLNDLHRHPDGPARFLWNLRQAEVRLRGRAA